MLQSTRPLAQQRSPSRVARGYSRTKPGPGPPQGCPGPGPRGLARLPVQSTRKLRQTLCPFILVLVVRCGEASGTPGRSAGDGGGGGGEPMEKIETRGMGGLTLEELEARSRVELLPDRL